MKRSVKILWFLFWVGLISVVGIFTAANYGLFGKMPSITELENPEADIASEVYTSDGLLMGKYYQENRSEVKYTDISQNVIKALIATEDERFYNHSGIDAQAVGRAVVSFGADGGGSTLTQQIAKLMLGQGRGNKLERVMQKVKEWIVAVKLERNFTKEELVTLYLNRAPWMNVYGIRNASRLYFQKEPKDLKVEEAAVLVGMLKGSSIYDPIRHPDASLNRRNTVLNQMAACQQHYLTDAEAAKLKAKPLITNYKKIDEDKGVAPYFRDVLREYLKNWGKSHKNPKTGEPYDVMRDGLRVYTTIHSKMQQYAEEAVVQHMPVIQKKLDWIMRANGTRMWKGREDVIERAIKQSERWKNLKEEKVSDENIRKTFNVPVRMKVFAWNTKREKDTTMTPYDSVKYHKQILQTSFACMDPHTGEVKCWVGGIDYKWFKFDHITAKRQVGSTIKPLIYSLAVQDAGYSPSTEIQGGSFMYGGKMKYFGGGGSMANCLAYSKNAASVRLTNLVGVKKVIEFAQSAGIKEKLPPYTSLALGAAEIPMLEMLQSYTMFPNKSLTVEPIIISRIEDKAGNLLQEFTATPKQVLSEASAYTMVQLMQGVVKIGTAKALNGYNIPVAKAGKTGTTNDNSDGWFIGYTPELLAGTWVGCDDPFLRIYAGTSGGNEMALPSWGKFMAKVYADKKLNYGKLKEFEKPPVVNNEELSADGTTWDRIFSQGGTEVQDEGNPDASDFIDAPMPEETPTEEIPIESEFGDKAVAADTAKKITAKPDTTKQTVPPAVKPAEDKTKKTPKPETPKPSAPKNDF
jgi:penicillin-binding protein 1A